MKKTGWIVAVALVLLVGWAAYTAAQQGSGGQPGMPGMSGQPGSGMGPAGMMMGGGMMGMMMGGQSGQMQMPASQMETMMKVHGLTAEQATALAGQCTQVMAQAAPAAPETK